jgi:hypothetical protein
MKTIVLAALALICTSASVQAQNFSSEDLARRTIERRAVEAAIWGMPLVNTDAMRQAYFRDVGAKYNDICYFSKPQDWKFQVTTPNASTNYIYLNYNLKDGPVVVEVPAAINAGLLGSMVNAWDEPMADIGPAGEDQGKGGKYLLLPPDFKGETPPGYFALRYPTYNGYALYRAIRNGTTDADTAAALALVKKLRVYPLSQAANGAQMLTFGGRQWINGPNPLRPRASPVGAFGFLTFTQSGELPRR